MWKLVKNDISYNRLLFISIYLVLVPLILINIKFGTFRKVILFFLFSSIVFIGALTSGQEQKAKSFRMILGLPLSLRKIAISRHLVWLGHILTVFILLTVSIFLYRRGSLPENYGWQFLGHICLFILWIISMDIFFNLKHFIKKRSRTYFFRGMTLFLDISFSTLVVLVSSFYVKGRLVIFLEKLFFSPVGAFCLFLGALASILLAIYIFEHRTDFTEMV